MPERKRPLPIASPEFNRFDPSRLKRIETLLQQGVRDKLFPCAVYQVTFRGETLASGAFGIPQPDSEAQRSATLETLFDLASLTKTFTGVLLLQATEEAKLHLGLRVQDLLSEAALSPVADVTLTQLATHTSGLPPWKPLYRSSQPLKEILETPLEAEPGTRYAYSDLGYITLTKILERVYEQPLDRLVLEKIIAPLELTETFFNPPASLRERTAATANCPFREGKTLVGEVHDANAFSMGGVSGHAGLFSTAGNVTKYVQGLHSLLSPLARKKAEQNQIPEAIGGHSIGWFTARNGMLPKGDFLSDRCFGHTGFTGTMLVTDPEHSLTLTLLTNRVYFPADATRALRLRRYFSNLVGAALTD